MKLFKISQTANRNYDTYDSAVVAAENEYEARQIIPGEEYGPYDDKYRWVDGYLQRQDHEGLWRGGATVFGTWVSDLADIKVEYIGEAKEGTPKGTILASFNAG